jgi:hypothetical protein
MDLCPEQLEKGTDFMECLYILFFSSILLVVGVAILGPLILLLGQGTKALENLSDHDQRDFFIGFFGIIVLNALLSHLSLALRGDSAPPETRATVSLALPWVVNLVLLIFFAFYRRWIALGALALVSFLLAWVILAGIIFFAGCLVVGGISSLFESYSRGY